MGSITNNWWMDIHREKEENMPTISTKDRIVNLTARVEHLFETRRNIIAFKVLLGEMEEADLNAIGYRKHSYVRAMDDAMEKINRQINVLNKRKADLGVEQSVRDAMARADAGTATEEDMHLLSMTLGDYMGVTNGE